MSQTSYLTQIANAFSGLISDIGPNGIKSCLNNSGVVLPFGIAVKISTSSGTVQDGVTPVAAAGDKAAGILAHSHSTDSISIQGSTVIGGSIGVGLRANMLTSGKIYVYVEQAVAEGDPAFARIANSANTTDGTQNQKGQFRKDADSSQVDVWTITPTAANATLYGLHIETVPPAGPRGEYNFETVSSGAASATTICNSFRADMAANAEFTAQVVATGTATLILTSQLAGMTINPTSSGDGAFASITNTSPMADTAIQIRGAYYTRAAPAAGWAEVAFNTNVAYFA